MNGAGEILFEKFKIIDCLKKDENYGVYLANHIYLSKKIFLKILNTETGGDKQKSERFKREAKILARLDHPNIIKVLDFGTYNKYFYISFEYFESKNLRVLIKENKFSISEKENLTVQLLDGLSFAHRNKVIHRDIKPENILIDNNLHLKISDFGLAFSTNETLVTSQYSILGTPSYMAPEQIRGEPVTQKCDLFSAGIVIYELFTGNNPFLGRDAADSINKIINFKEEEISYSEYEVPINVEKLIKKLIGKKVSERINNAGEALNILGIEQQTDLNSKSKKSFNRIWAFAVIISIILITSFVFLMNSQKKEVPVARNELKQDAVSKFPQNDNQKEPIKKIVEPEKHELKNSSIKKVDVIKPEQRKEDSTNTNDENQELAAKDNTEVTPAKFGKLFVNCFPFAKIYIDSEYFETTPLRNNLIVPAGYHNIQLKSTKYPVYEQNILIKTDSILNISVNLDTAFGFLNCNVFPWAYVYVNQKNYGQTPLKEPIVLQAGEYIITLKNRDFAEKNFNIKIFRSDTVKINYNFKK